MCMAVAERQSKPCLQRFPASCPSRVFQLRKGKLDPARVRVVFVTHMHGDHCFGIGGLIAAVCEVGGCRVACDSLAAWLPAAVAAQHLAGLPATYIHITRAHLNCCHGFPRC